MIGLRLYTRRPPACLALSAKRRLHRSTDGDARARESGEEERRGWQGVEKDLGEAEQEELGVANA